MEILRKTPIEITTLTPNLWEETLSLYRHKFGYKADYSPYIAKLMEGETSIWNWKFQEGKSLRLVALRGNEVIGHIGALIRDFNVYGETLKGAELVEGVIKSIWQGGVLKDLLTKLESELQKLGVEFVILFPNPYAERVALKRATAYQPAFLMEKKLTGGKIERIERIKDLSQISQFPHALERFLETANQRFIGTKRTVEYLNWRFAKNPVEDYAIFLSRQGENIDGHVVLKTHAKTKGHIVDLFAENEEVFKRLVEFSEGYLVTCGAETISLYKPGGVWDSYLEELGFKKTDWGRKMAIITPNASSPVVNLQSWYLTMSEHSIF